jgi:hypothetical protein
MDMPVHSFSSFMSLPSDSALRDPDQAMRLISAAAQGAVQQV